MAKVALFAFVFSALFAFVCAHSENAALIDVCCAIGVLVDAWWAVGRRLSSTLGMRSTSIAVACVPRALTELHDLDDVLMTGLAAEAAGEAAAAVAGTQGARRGERHDGRSIFV